MKITSIITDKYCRSGKIIVDDIDEYFAEVTDNRHGFKVIDINGKEILTSVVYQSSRLKVFLGLGGYQIKANDKEIAYVKHHGFLGLKRSIDYDGKSWLLPRKHKFDLLNGEFSYDRKNHTVNYLNEGSNLSIKKPLIGICFYWLLRQIGMENMG